MHPSRLSAPAIRRGARRLSLLLILLMTAPCLGAASASAAVQGPSVIVKVHQASGLISPYFQLSARPGRTVRAGSLQLVNPTSRRLRVHLDPVDAITTNTLGSAYALTDAGRHGATAWLKVGQGTATLAPHASRSVAVALTIPTSAAPGDYLAGVSVQALGQSQATNAGHGVAIGEIDRYAIGVEVKLPGPRHPAVHFTGARIVREPGGLAFLLAASNTGNVILKKVRGSVQVTDGHRVVASATIQPGTFVSHTSINYPVRAPREQPVPGAAYRVHATLFYGHSVARLDTTVHFGHAAAVTQQNYGGRRLPQSARPWRTIAVVFVALGVLIGAGLVVRRRARPLSRRAGRKALDRTLARPESLPVSIVRVSVDPPATRHVAAVLRPRLRRTDRLCDLGEDGLLMICPATSQAAATALRRDLYEHLARRPDLADLPIDLVVATAETATTSGDLLRQAKVGRGQEGRDPSGHDRPTTATRQE